MNFETVIGLEVHVELNTNSKIFSPTSAHFGNDQNANTNVIDWSFPGVLPVLNKGVVDAGIKAALALNMDIHKKMHFDRKNYFYPDNPKAYQISQFDEPIGYNGWIEVKLEDGTTKKIGIERAHLEEDAGKNTHGTDGYSYVDLNRQGVPLIEIVSEADMRSPEEAYAYLTALKEVIQYAGISDVKMEEGSMRVDANISLRPYGQEKFGTKTELKNLNSFSNVRKGLEYEVQRQAEILRSGGQIRQEHAVTMKRIKQPFSCVSRKGLQTTATSQNQTYPSLKFLTSGLRKCGLSCQSFQKNVVRVMYLTLVYQTTMLVS
ncbi:glutamyl tRNA-Gln amidotransferase chain B [Streptococcus pneumoniae]|nr:glutamyl tRNA-Gln amidotransferase chain B [Streptococcus pneumoniae]